MNIDSLITDLRTYIDRSDLPKAKIAAKIGLSPSGLSHLLARKCNPTGAQTLAILQLTKGKQKMNQQITNTTPVDYELQNAKVLAKYSNNDTRIEHFQSGLGLTENDGYLPGRQVQPEFADEIAQLLKDGRIDEATSIINQIANGVKVEKSTARQARPNPLGSTRGSVAVQGDGSRGSWISGQEFSADNGGQVLHLDKDTVEFSKSEVLKTRNKQIAKSHGITDQKLNVKNGQIINFDNISMEDIGKMHNVCKAHNDSIMADEKTYHENMRRANEREARLERKKNGNGNLDDLVSEYNLRRD